MEISLSANFGYVIISCAVIALQIMLTGFIVVGRARDRVFTKLFLSENFGDEHYQEIHEDIQKTHGYPDMGNGRYSQKLDYSDWLMFNKAQRVHYNYIEHVASILIVTLLGGLVYPVLSSIFGFLYAFGRLLYAIFYLSSEGASNKWRGLGAVLCDLSFLGNFILAIMSGINFLTT